MKDKKKILRAEQKVQVILAKFKFVKWDRFTEDTPNLRLNFYGWIQRKDAYKDFIVLTIFKDTFETEFITSSAKWDKKICEILKVPKRKQLHCQRVEWYFKIPNVIKLPPT